MSDRMENQWKKLLDNYSSPLNKKEMLTNFEQIYADRKREKRRTGILTLATIIVLISSIGFNYYMISRNSEVNDIVRTAKQGENGVFKDLSRSLIVENMKPEVCLTQGENSYSSIHRNNMKRNDMPNHGKGHREQQVLHKRLTSSKSEQSSAIHLIPSASTHIPSPLVTSTDRIQTLLCPIRSTGDHSEKLKIISPYYATSSNGKKLNKRLQISGVFNIWRDKNNDLSSAYAENVGVEIMYQKEIRSGMSIETHAAISNSQYIESGVRALPLDYIDRSDEELMNVVSYGSNAMNTINVGYLARYDYLQLSSKIGGSYEWRMSDGIAFQHAVGIHAALQFSQGGLWISDNGATIINDFQPQDMNTFYLSSYTRHDLVLTYQDEQAILLSFLYHADLTQRRTHHVGNDKMMGWGIQIGYRGQL